MSPLDPRNWTLRDRLGVLAFVAFMFLLAWWTP